jgi:hypothetical protein
LFGDVIGSRGTHLSSECLLRHRILETESLILSVSLVDRLQEREVAAESRLLARGLTLRLTG